MYVTFLVAGNERTGSTRLRILNAVPFLEDEGFSCDVVLFQCDLEDSIRSKMRYGFYQIWFYIQALIAAYRTQILVIQKHRFPRPLMWTLRQLCSRIVYDIDDAVYTSADWVDSEDKQRTKRVKYTFASCDWVIAASTSIKAFAEKTAENVDCLPTTFQREKYSQLRASREQNGDENVVRLGWIGNPQNLRYLQSIETELETLLNKYDQLQLTIITGRDRPVEPLLARQDVTYVDWSLEKETEYLASVDIGIRPLLDDEWTRAKGHSSVVQYMAAGLPVVVTPVGAITELVVDGDSGFFATTGEEWIESITELIENPTLRRQMGERAVDGVGERWHWTEEYAREMARIFEQLE